MSDEEYSDSAAGEDSESQNAEEEQMVINPDSVRERIDVYNLYNFKPKNFISPS